MDEGLAERGAEELKDGSPKKEESPTSAKDKEGPSESEATAGGDEEKKEPENGAELDIYRFKTIEVRKGC